MTNLRPYPIWVCFGCAMATGGHDPGVATWHWGVCDVCSSDIYVTEPRDFGYPHFSGHEPPPASVTVEDLCGAIAKE